MGGSIAILFAGAMPGLVQSLIIFESLGRAEDCTYIYVLGPWTLGNLRPQKMELEILKYPNLLKIRPKVPPTLHSVTEMKVYPTIEAAVAKLTQKNPDIDKQSAATIVTRSLVKVTGKPDCHKSYFEQMVLVLVTTQNCWVEQ
jgi:hypothetical protein